MVAELTPGYPSQYAAITAVAQPGTTAQISMIVS